MAFSDKMREMMNKGMAVSRDLTSKAVSQAQTWGEMGVLKLELAQLRSQAEQLMAKLGVEAFAALSERGETSLSLDSPNIGGLVSKIEDIRRRIEERQAAYRKLGGKDSDLD